MRDAALRSAASDAVVTCDDADRALDLTRATASVLSAERVAVELAHFSRLCGPGLRAEVDGGAAIILRP